MKNKTMIMILTIISSILTVTFYYMSYIFNPKFYSTRNPLYVHSFREQGGAIRIILVLLILLLFTVLFIIYIIKDNEHLDLYDQVGTPEYYKKDNLFSMYRIFQYYTIISALALLIRDGWRSITYDGSLLALYIFQTDLLLIMWDVVFGLFIVLTVTLLLEYIQYRKTIN